MHEGGVERVQFLIPLADRAQADAAAISTKAQGSALFVAKGLTRQRWVDLPCRPRCGDDFGIHDLMRLDLLKRVEVDTRY